MNSDWGISVVDSGWYDPTSVLPYLMQIMIIERQLGPPSSQSLIGRVERVERLVVRVTPEAPLTPRLSASSPRYQGPGLASCIMSRHITSHHTYHITHHTSHENLKIPTTRFHSNLDIIKSYMINSLRGTKCLQIFNSLVENIYK